MNKPIIIGAALLTLFVVSSFAPLAAAQYQGVGGGGTGSTLEEQLKLARSRIADVQANPHAGSGTPYLDPSGTVGAILISGAIFGAIFIAFVVKAKQVEKSRKQ
ncbi:MAG: hypothetical protein ACREA7_02160 [Nitrosotalea sp.]